MRDVWNRFEPHLKGSVYINHVADDDAPEKVRAQRVQRLKAILDARLDNPIPIVDALLAELHEGDPQTALWEQLQSLA